MQKTITLAANSEFVEIVSGRFFTVISCTTGFRIEADRQGRRNVVAGSKVSGPAFKKLTFIETSGADNVITFDAGMEAYEGQSEVVATSSSILAVEGDSFVTLTRATGLQSTMANNAIVDVPYLEIFGIHTYKRKYAEVTNSSGNSLEVAILAGGGTEIFVSRVEGNTTKRFDCDADLRLKNISGGALIIRLLEVWNSRPIV